MIRFRLFAAATLVALPLAAQQNFDAVQIKPQKVAEGIWMLTGSGGNIGVMTGKDATFIIDDQFAPLSAKIEAAVKELTGQPIKYIINSHWHGDHTGGNENFGSKGSIIIAHDNVRVRMSKEQFVAAFNQRTPPSPAVALPVITFSDTLTLHQNGETIRVFHVKNAHTDTDAIIHFLNANVVHTGDVINRGGYPFLDTSTGGTFLGEVAAVQTLLVSTNATTQYIPGHGPLTTRAELEAYGAMLKAIRDRVWTQVKAGKTLDQVKAMKLLADLDATYGKGNVKADAIVEMAYGELVKQK